MAVPPLNSAINPALMQQYLALMEQYAEAMAAGDTALMNNLIRQMWGLTGIAGGLRATIIAIQPFIRPALMAAGAAWSTVSAVMGDVAVFVTGFAGFLVTPEFLITMGVVVVAVLIYWFLWHRWQQQMQAAGYRVSINVTPQTGFPPKLAAAAAPYRRAVTVPHIGPLEVLEKRARWEWATAPAV